jgi:hypothetical protein
MLIIGKIYRLKFPGIAARVIKAPQGMAPPKFPFLVESLFLRARWYVNEHGEPDNIHSPKLVIGREPSGVMNPKKAAKVSD